MSFLQARCKSTLSELILIFQDLFSWVENFLRLEFFFGRSRICCTGRQCFLAGREVFGRSRIFCTGRDIFWSVENSFSGSKSFRPIESVFSGREVFWFVDREKSEKLDEKFLWEAVFSRQNGKYLVYPLS